MPTGYKELATLPSRRLWADISFSPGYRVSRTGAHVSYATSYSTGSPLGIVISFAGTIVSNAIRSATTFEGSQKSVRARYRGVAVPYAIIVDERGWPDLSGTRTT